MTKYIETFLTHLAAIAAALTVIAENHGGGKAEATVAVKEPAKKSGRKAKVEEPAKVEDGPTKADLRKLGTSLVAGGKKTEFLAILKKYGAANISALGDHEIDVVLPELEAALGKKLVQIED